MKSKRVQIIIAALLAAGTLVILVTGCARYERKVVPFKMPTAYPNAVTAGEALIAAQSYDDPQEAKDAFGFDIIKAGILPVQVIFDNQGSHPLEIIASRTYFVDRDDNLWPIISAELAYDRIAQETELGEVAPEGAKAGILAGTAGAIIGAAIGIVSGHNVGDAAMKGAAVGAAAGMTMGGAKGFSNTEVRYKIREDLQTRSLERKPVPPHEIAHGFIFFPGEAKQAKELRLQIKETDSQIVHNLILKFY